MDGTPRICRLVGFAPRNFFCHLRKPEVTFGNSEQRVVAYLIDSIFATRNDLAYRNGKEVPCSAPLFGFRYANWDCQLRHLGRRRCEP